MPYPSPHRRTLLVSAAGALLLTGCTAGPDAARERVTVTGRTRARAAGDSAALLVRYDAVLAAHPALAERLRPLRAAVAAHEKAFGGAAPVPSGSPSASPAPVPAAPAGALTDLASAERALADRRTKALPDVDGETARLLASVAAAGAAHAYLLAEGAK
ncbi:hypothetical protein KUM39_04120 [Streptomyces sp. J2-1]|uniref:hypothetical protein n=1 Tax=Streptomyces corallincola TaxID=2851888 RepID=UPI001C38F821|nr:hypothetical protein [Streptomyces corallincola]MBV2353550.1 hypothetical protein [Streptomyces corallincola]